MKRIFVYGTLKKGGGLSTYLELSDFIEEREIKGYKMYDLGWYPGIKKTGDESDSIKGEVYEVNDETLAVLDRVEGVPGLYTREVEGDLELYVYARDINHYKEIEGGVFDVNR